MASVASKPSNGVTWDDKGGNLNHLLLSTLPPTPAGAAILQITRTHLRPERGLTTMTGLTAVAGALRVLARRGGLFSH